MSFILNITTAVPEYKMEKEDLVECYANAVVTSTPERFKQKLSFLNRKTKINTRYSCIPDFKGSEQELFLNGNYNQPVEKRMEIYRKKVIPLASKVIDKLLAESEIEAKEITHLITVSCTGLFAPGLEFLIAEKYGIQNIEKTGINFLGCYAAIKGIKHAHYIAQTDPNACILIVCVELCSLHFYPSEKDEDIISNLLFADGAAAVLMCGNKSKLAENKKMLEIDTIGSTFIPNTADFMKWELSSSAFKMHLSADVVKAIKENIYSVIHTFLGGDQLQTDYWAVHPGGVKIVEAVQQSLNLTEENVEDSLAILNQYGNMSSPTILFILKNIFDKIKKSEKIKSEKVVACAFGPGLNVELLSLKSVDTKTPMVLKNLFADYAVEN
ncbi:MAG: type III polyketide synthase [Bacteroidia bacterium]